MVKALRVLPELPAHPADTATVRRRPDSRRSIYARIALAALAGLSPVAVFLAFIFTAL